MGNHFYFLLETPKPRLVADMAWFQTTYTVRFNRRHRLSGHLFQGRYKSVVIDGADGASIRRVGDYIHLNPARARLLEERKPGSLLDAARTEEEEQSAQERLRRGLDVVGLTLEEVRGLKCADPRKEILAWLLKTKTPMRNIWITERLRLGHSSRVCMLVRSVQKEQRGRSDITRILLPFERGAGRHWTCQDPCDWNIPARSTMS